jgi:hypothetical protein
MKKLILFVCCCAALQCTAQKRSYNRFSKDFRLTARVNPLSLFNPAEGAIIAGIEKRIKKRVSVGGDAGYIFWSLNTTSFQGTSTMQGFLFRPAIRYYTTDAMHFYIEGAANIKYINNRQTDWLGMNCIDDVPSYYEFTEYNIRSTTAGFSANFGVCENIFKSQKLYLEFYGGIGMRYRDIKISNDKRACITSSVNESPFDPLRTGKSVLPFIPAGIRLGYTIK